MIGMLFAGTLLAAVTLPPNPTACETYAAEEFQRYAGDFPAVFERSAAELGADGFRLYERNGALHVAGGRRGILYGVYEALERFWGVRWYASDFTVDPGRRDVRLPAGLDMTEKPAFRTRVPFYYDVCRDLAFAAHLRANGSWIRGLGRDPRFGGESGRFCRGLDCHSCATMVPAAKYEKTHPEYFAMRNGKRLVNRDPQFEMQLCLTNPDVLQIFVTNVCAMLEKDPDAEEYSVGQNDNLNYCECPVCAAVNAEEDSTAGTMIRFANRVAAEVEKRFPGRKAVTCGYQWTRKPPKKTRPAANVLISFSSIECDQSHSLVTGKYRENVAVRADLEGWRALGAHFNNWMYVTQFSDFQMPFPNLGSIREDLVYYRDHGVEEMLAEGCYCCYGCDLEALRAWMVAKWLWDPELDEEKLVDDFCNGYYRSAAPYVKRYYKLLRDLPAKNNADHSFCLDCCHVTYDRQNLVTDDFLAEADKLWTAAEKAAEAESPAIRKHVAWTAFPVRFTIFRRLSNCYAPVPYSLRREDPSADPVARRHRDLATGLLKIFDSGRRIYISEGRDSAAQAKAWREKVSRAAAAVPIKGTESFSVGSAELDVCNLGRDVDWVKDPEATDGRALRFRNTVWNWNARLDLPGNVFDHGEQYRLRLRVKVEKTPGGVDNAALGVGFCNPHARTEHGDRARPASFFADGRWQWVDLGLFTPQEAQYLWIMAGPFDKKKYERNPAVEALYLDRVEISRADSVRTFDLVRAGQPTAVIVSTGNALVDRDIVFFTNAVFQATGALLPIVAKADDARNALSFSLRPASLVEEDKWETAFPATNRMVITSTSVGCRWELNRILEEQCGFVACLPGSDGTHFGTVRDIALERTPHRGDSSYRINRYMWRENCEWERACGGKRIDPRQTLFRSGIAHHNMSNILPASKYAEDPWREKVMPLIDGVRTKPVRPNCSWHPCFSSETALDEAVKNILAELEKHPEIRAVSLGQTDGGGHCHCPACVKLNGGEHKKSLYLPSFENWSNAYFSFVNRIVERISPTHPDLLFGCMAYSFTTDPPDFPMHPNVLVHITTDIYQSRDPGVRARREALFKAWNAKCSHLGVADYDYEIARYAPPRLHTDLSAQFFRQKLAFPALDEIFTETSSCGGEGPKKWLHYRLLFDATRDAETEMARWCRACCGKEAAPHLRAYYREWEHFWMGEAVTKTPWYHSVTNGPYCDFWDPNWIFALDPQTVARARAEMESVVAAAKRSGDPRQKERARRLMLFHRHYEARIACMGLGMDVTDRRLATPAQTVTFVDSLSGALGDAYRTLRATTDEILSHVLADEPFDDTDTVARNHGRWTHMVEALRADGYDPYFISKACMGGVCTFRDDPTVKAAVARAAANPKTAEPFRALFQRMYSDGPFENAVVEPGDDRAADLAKWAKSTYNSTVEPLENGGFRFRAKKTAWSAVVRVYRGMKPGHWYKARAILRNEDHASPLEASLILRAAGANYQLGPMSRVRLEKGASGEAVSMTYLYKTGETYQPQGVVDIYIDASGLRAGEALAIDRVELLDLGSVDL